MYFTIDAAQPSSSTQDAWRSFNDLRGHARVLGTISASFRAEAAEVTSAYGAALSQGGPERWSRFVSAAFALGRHGAELESLIGLAARERAAWRVFARIADENADLLETPALATA